MDGPRDYEARSDKDKYMISLMYGIEMSLFTNRNRFKDLTSELIFTKGESGGEEGKIRSLGLTDIYYHMWKRICLSMQEMQV